MTKRPKQQPSHELEDLRARLDEAEELLRAIRAGEIDALVTSGADGDQIFTLQGAERPYRILVEAMQEGAVTLSTSGIILYSNHRFAELLKLPLEQVLGVPIKTFVAPADQPVFEALLQQSWSAIRRGEITLRASDGVDVPTTIAFSALPLEEAPAVGLVVTDLTSQKQAETEIQRLNADLEQRVLQRTAQLTAANQQLEAEIAERIRAEAALRANQQVLSEQRERYRVTLSSIGDAVIATDTQGAITFMNPVAERLTGWLQAEALGRDIRDVFHIVNEQTRQPVENPVLRVLREGMIAGLANHTVLIARDGQERPIDDSGAPIGGVDGQIIGVILVFRDITERRRAEQAFQAELAEIESIYNTAPIGLAVLDRDLRYVRLNEHLAEINGIPVAQHLGKTVRDILPTPLADTIEPQLRRILDTGEPMLNIELHGETAAQPGVPRDWVEHWLPLKTADGQVIALSAVVQEVTERNRDDRFTRMLYQLTAALAAESTVDTVVQAITHQINPALGASFAVVCLLTADKRYLDLVNVPDQFPDIRQRYGHMSIEEPVPIAEVARTGRPLYFESYLDFLAAYPALTATLQQLKAEATLYLPLIVRDQVTGVLRVGFDHARRIDQKERDFWMTLASNCAQALERARLFEEAEDARLRAEQLADRATRLQVVTARLSAALTPVEVAQVVVAQGLAALGATASAVYAVNENRTALSMIGANGYAADALQVTQQLLLDTPLPVAEVVRSGQPIWLEKFDAYEAQYPFARTIPGLEPGARVALPLQVKGQIMGSLVLSFAQDRPFTDDDKQFMLTLAHQCAQALERARLYEAEHQAHLDADTARRRFHLLADASALLATSLDYETTLRNLDRILVPAFADYYMVDVLEVDDGDQLRRVAVNAVEPDVREALEETVRRYSPDPKGVYIRQALYRRQSYWVPENTQEMLDQAATDDEHRALYRRIGARSSINIPLIVRGQAIGVLSVGMTRSGRRYTAEDVSFGEELARRISQAIDNARLYEKAQMNTETLRQQVAEQTQELQHALERAQAADRAKSLMVANVSHEMRTPLSSITGFSNLLLSRQLAITKQQELLTAIKDEGWRLTALVEDLLDLQRIESGHLTLQLVEVDLAALITDTLQKQSSPDQVQRIRFVLERPLRVQADPNRIRQVLLNLVSNALKFSEGEIEITLHQEPTTVHVSVRDQGMGIPSHELDRLFQLFHRGEMAERERIRGTGLGLALCKEIVEAHHGRIWAESAGEGQGAMFHFTLPIVSG